MKERINRIYLASDHAGFSIKEKIKKFLNKKYKIEDLSPVLIKGDDYPDYAFAVAEKVSKDKNSKGILVCGTGTGMTIAANKVKGIRAVAAYDEYSAKMSRVDNNSNILGLRGRKFPFSKIKKIITIWLNTEFSEKERHDRRIRKIINYERKR